MREEIRKMRGPPFLCYMFLMLVVLILFVVSTILPSEPMHSTLLNITLGILSSTVVAFLLDYSNTIRQLVNDKKEFLFLTVDLKHKIQDLLNFRVVNCSSNSDDTEYCKWVCKLRIENFSITDRSNNMPIEAMFISLFDKILESAMQLERYSPLLSDNMCMEDDFLVLLGELIRVLQVIVDKGKNNKWDEYSYTSLFTECFEVIVLLFPEYKEDFFGKWNAQKVEEKYYIIKK